MMKEKINNKDFLKILKPIHKNHTEKTYKKLIHKMYSLKQSLKKRSLEHEVACDITSNDIKKLFIYYYGKKCIYCGSKKLTIKTIACDHIKPLSRGGDSSMNNLQLICKTCNTRKGPLDDDEYRLFLSWVNQQEDNLKSYILRKMSKGGKF